MLQIYFGEISMIILGTYKIRQMPVCHSSQYDRIEILVKQIKKRGNCLSSVPRSEALALPTPIEQTTLEPTLI